MTTRWVGAVAVLLLLAGCGGGPSASEKAAAARAKASASASASAEKAAEQRQQAAEARRAKASAVYKECRAVAGALDDKLAELNSRLSVGMSFSEYGEHVGAAKVAYDRLLKDAKARGGISDRCINKVAVPLEGSLRAYLSAYETWNNCDYPCDISEGKAKSKVQAKWLKAGRLSNKADTALTNLQP